MRVHTMLLQAAQKYLELYSPHDDFPERAQLRGAVMEALTRAGPQRRWMLELNIQADEWPWIVRELERLAPHIVEHGPICNSVSGSPDAGSSVHIVESPDQTHEKYFQELDSYLERVRALEGQ